MTLVIAAVSARPDRSDFDMMRAARRRRPGYPVYDRLPEVTECKHERIGPRRFGNDPSSSKTSDGLRDLVADPADDAVGSHQAAAATEAGTSSR